MDVNDQHRRLLVKQCSAAFDDEVLVFTTVNSLRECEFKIPGDSPDITDYSDWALVTEFLVELSTKERWHERLVLHAFEVDNLSRKKRCIDAK